MPNPKIWLAVLCGVIAGMSLHVFAQQSPASNDPAPNADAAAAKETATAENGKTVEDKSFTKRAILAGRHPEVQHGVTVYCREEPIVGSRFTKKLCGSQVRWPSYWSSSSLSAISSNSGVAEETAAVIRSSATAERRRW